MAKNKSTTVLFKRKRQKKTDYKARISLLKSSKPRLVIRKALNNYTVQLIEYNPKGDKVLISAHARELFKGYGWKGHRGNLSSAYLTGLLLGLKAKKKGLKEAVADLGLARVVKGSGLFAVLKGVIDGGINVPCKDDTFPNQDRISGKNVADYATKLDKQKLDKQFGNYQKTGLNPKEMVKHFEDVKKKILTKWQ